MKRIFFGLIPLIILSLFVLRSDFLKIKSIDVRLNKISCAGGNQIKDTSLLLGQNILFLNSSQAKEKIENKFICVKDVTISRHFPDKVNLLVSGRLPVAVLSLLNNAEATSSTALNIATPSAQTAPESFLVDDEGIIFSKESQDNLPKIYFNNANFIVGSKLENETKDTLKILEKVKTFSLDPQSLVVSDHYLIVFSVPKVIFRLGENIDIQLASLQLILEKAKIDDVRPEFIDLRFDKPTVRFAPKT